MGVRAFRNATDLLSNLVSSDLVPPPPDYLIARGSEDDDFQELRFYDGDDVSYVYGWPDSLKIDQGDAKLGAHIAHVDDDHVRLVFTNGDALYERVAWRCGFYRSISFWWLVSGWIHDEDGRREVTPTRPMIDPPPDPFMPELLVESPAEDIRYESPPSVVSYEWSRSGNASAAYIVPEGRDRWWG